MLLILFRALLTTRTPWNLAGSGFGAPAAFAGLPRVYPTMLIFIVCLTTSLLTYESHPLQFRHCTPQSGSSVPVLTTSIINLLYFMSNKIISLLIPNSQPIACIQTSQYPSKVMGQVSVVL